MVEPGGPEPRFSLADGDALWTDRARGLYAQAAAGQWDPSEAVDWKTHANNAPRQGSGERLQPLPGCVLLFSFTRGFASLTPG